MEPPHQHSQIPTIEQWVAHLDGMIAGSLAGVPIDGTMDEKRTFVDSFRDEFGARRATDGALLSRVLGIGYERGGIESEDLDFQLWEAALGAGGEWKGLISKKNGLVDSHMYAIEHRTLIELCALHALSYLAETEMRDRVDQLVDWHTRELQPDNGINRPWGLHAFVIRSVEASDIDHKLNAMLHAQTLANNCCITLGKPDILSALILLDSANALRPRN